MWLGVQVFSYLKQFVNNKVKKYELYALEPLYSYAKNPHQWRGTPVASLLICGSYLCSLTLSASYRFPASYRRYFSSIYTLTSSTDLCPTPWVWVHQLGNPFICCYFPWLLFAHVQYLWLTFMQILLVMSEVNEYTIISC